MDRLKALEIPEKPYILWYLTSDSAEDDPLVLDKSEVPEYIYGVCPLKIAGGELVARTTPEMNAFKAESDIAQVLSENASRMPNINAETFAYDGKVFPMDEVSRTYYSAMGIATTDCNVMTTSAELYILPLANINAFVMAFLTKLFEISKHDI